MYHIDFHANISGIAREQWNLLAADRGPFLRHEFLHALEESDSVTRHSGWQPCHLSVHSGLPAQPGAELLAVLPLYLKYHSYGEYVFDWSWADAYRQNGLQYYPKLLTAIPFTPSISSRLLTASAHDTDSLLARVTEQVRQYAAEHSASSWHILFPKQQESARWQQAGLMQRCGTQFHWFNEGYKDFAHFLSFFSSRKRKNVRREREAVKQQGIEFEHFPGAEITPQLWEQFYRFYQSTYAVRGQRAYLRRTFFERVSATMPENLLLVMAKKEGRYIAGALSFQDKHTLYGRYWGCSAEYQFLHFETCYYQGIEYCIKHGLKSFDSGAQGEHKIQRGFVPIKTWSNHWIKDPRFSQAIENFCRQERAHVDAYMEAARQAVPFKSVDASES